MTNTLEKNFTQDLTWISRKDMKRWYDHPRGAPKGYSSMRKTARRVQRKLQRVHEPIAHKCTLTPGWGNADSETWNFRYYPESARIILHNSYYYNFCKNGRNSVMYEANARSLRSISRFLFTKSDYYLPAIHFEAMLDAYLYRKERK